MAAGDLLLDVTGNRILDASGNLQLDDGGTNDCCCTPPFYYYQMRRCADDATVDLWWPQDRGLPIHIIRSGICYYAQAGSPQSTTPGTVLATVTTTPSCTSSACSCSFCGSVDTPSKFTVTISGVTLCTCVAGSPPPGSFSVTGTINGTYCVHRGPEQHSCIWTCALPGITYTQWSANGCTGTKLVETIGGTLTLVRNSDADTWQVTATVGIANAFFNDTFASGTDCSSTFSGSNSETACGIPDSLGFGYGGSVTVTPGC